MSDDTSDDTSVKTSIDDAKRPPSVDKLAKSLADTGLPHALLVDAARLAIADGTPESARDLASATQGRMLTPVINGTGVLLHTNLGRAPVACRSDATYYNLEIDLTTGQRGDRQRTASALIARACGAEAAIAVNNCAAALLLVFTAIAAKRDVIVSRGELVEIGGGFRVPDIMAASSAKLVEVGTTNRTRKSDFVAALQSPAVDAALIASIHQSNYRIVGFTEAPSTADIAHLGVPLVVDIGSGLLDSRCSWLKGGAPSWLKDEPAARQTLADGADLVTFSCDKLLGGPQAGIIAGRADLVRMCAEHQLARALRPGAMVLEALQRTALAYLHNDGCSIEFWRMAMLTVEDLKKRLRTYKRTYSGIASIATQAKAGGGTLPGVEIPSVAVTLVGDYTRELRQQDRPIIARKCQGVTIVDLRTVHKDDDEYVARKMLEVAVAS